MIYNTSNIQINSSHIIDDFTSLVGEHCDDPNSIILDFLGVVAFFCIFKILMLLYTYQATNVITKLRMAVCEDVNLYDSSFADWVGRRHPLD